MSTIQYNYICVQRDCEQSKHLAIIKDEEDKDREEPCPLCSVPLKRIGQKAAAYLGSKEGQFQKMQTEIRKKAQKHDADPEIQKLKKKRTNEEITNLKTNKQ